MKHLCLFHFLPVHMCIAEVQIQIRKAHTRMLFTSDQHGDVLPAECEIDESARMQCDELLG